MSARGPYMPKAPPQRAPTAYKNAADQLAKQGEVKRQRAEIEGLRAELKEARRLLTRVVIAPTTPGPAGSIGVYLLPPDYNSMHEFYNRTAKEL